MKITIDIKDSKANFFLELLHSFRDFVSVEYKQNEETELSPAHKKILDERLESYKQNPDNVIPWKEVLKELKKS